jgi:hypothetical protein
VHQMRLDQLLRDVHAHDHSPKFDEITESHKVTNPAIKDIS